MFYSQLYVSVFKSSVSFELEKGYGVSVFLTIDALKVIENGTERKSDEKLLQRIRGINLIAACSSYHSSH